MSTIRTAIRFAALLMLAMLMNTCATGQPPSPFKSAEPPVDSVQTRAPRTLRLYFEQLPDVPRSTVLLEGPTGMIDTRGMHTMGADDLMMEINAQLTDGVYNVHWTTYVEGDPNQYQGSFGFTVKQN